MSLLIKGMEMPRIGESVTIYPDGRVVRNDTYNGGTIRGEAVSVPPHGRLGDLDELFKEAFKRSEKREGYYNCLDAVISAYDIENAPTIIPASGGEET